METIWHKSTPVYQFPRDAHGQKQNGAARVFGRRRKDRVELDRWLRSNRRLNRDIVRCQSRRRCALEIRDGLVVIRLGLQLRVTRIR